MSFILNNFYLQDDKMQSIIKKCLLISFLILAQNSVFALFIEDLRGWLQSSTTSIVCAANKKRLPLVRK